MKTKKKYYAVVATNGFMVANNWKTVEIMSKYFRGEKCKGYKSKEDAIIAARTEFNNSHEFVKYYDEIKLNTPYFSKNMINMKIIIPNNKDNLSYISKSTPMITIEP